MPTPEDVVYCEQQFDEWLKDRDKQVELRTLDAAVNELHAYMKRAKTMNQDKDLLDHYLDGLKDAINTLMPTRDALAENIAGKLESGSKK